MRFLFMDWSIRIIFLMLLGSSLVALNIFPNPTVFSKEIWLYLTTAITMLVASLTLLCYREKISFYFVDYLAIGFLIIIPITNLFLISDYNSTVIIQQVCMGLCYLSLRVISQRIHYIKVINLFIQSLLVVFILNIAIGLHQYLGLSLSYYPKLGPTGLFFNPGPYGIYLAALTPWIIVYTVQNIIAKQYGRSISGVVLLGLGIFLIAISLSRSAWIGLFCGIALPLIVFLGDRTIRAASKRIVLFALGCIFFYFLLYYVKVDSSNGRILIWQVSYTMGKDHWMTGLGLGKFPQKYMHYQKAYFDAQVGDVSKYERLAGDVRYAFNDFLQVFIEGGVLAVLIFISIVMSILLLLIAHLFKRDKQPYHHELLMFGSGIIGSIIVVLTAGLTAYPMQVLPISILLWTQVFLGVTILSKRDAVPIKGQQQLVPVGVFSLLLATSILYYGTIKAKSYLHLRNAPNIDYESIMQYRNILHDNAEFYFKVSRIQEKEKKEEMALNFLHKAVLYNPCPVYYYRLGRYYEQINDMDKAFDSYDFVDRAIPNLVRPKYLKALVFYNTNDTLNFNRYTQEVLDFDPKIHGYRVYEMRKDLRDKLQSF